MGVNFKELQELQRRLEQAQSQIPALMQEIVDEISNEFLQGSYSKNTCNK